MSDQEIEFEIEAIEEKEAPASYAQMGRLNSLGLVPLAVNFQLGLNEKTPPLVITNTTAKAILTKAKEQGLW